MSHPYYTKVPLLTLRHGAPETIAEQAYRRWERLAADRCDLKPAVDLQMRVLTVVAQVSETLRRGRLPRLSLPPKYLAAKLDRGVPVFAGEPIPLPIAALAPALLRIVDELASGGAGDAGRQIRDALVNGSIDAGALLVASIAREQQNVRAIAAHAGVAADLLWLAAEMTASPFADALRDSVFARAKQAQEIATALDAWNRGYCPACGSWPVAAEVAQGHRVLRCAFCSAAWELTSYACIYCGEEGEPFVTAAPDQERTDRRIEACASCGGYLKTIDVGELSPFPLVAITDLETMDLDVAAMQHNYARPPQKMFQRGR